ncbi:MAG: SDR family NAD(P)-dependent oxidoreductase [Mycoplasmatales bacterium]
MRKYVLITGSSSGIGQALAEDFLNESTIVIGIDCNNSTINHPNYQHIICDVSNFTQVEQAIKSITIPRIDQLVNCAGIVEKGLALDLPADLFASQVNTNLIGTFNICKCSIPLLLLAPDPAIVNISSIFGIKPVVEMAGYSSSKAGIIALTKTLALEHAPKIRVNAVAPGATLTPMLERRFQKSPELEQLFIESYPLKRIAQISEIISVIRFLLSKDASFITGTCIEVDGGISLI